MRKQQLQGLKKAVILGALALTVAIPAGAGAASAASTKSTGADWQQLNQITARYGIDLNALIQQYMQGKYPTVSKPSTGGGNTANPGTGTGSGGNGSTPVTKPGTPATKPSTPSQGSETGTVATSEYAAQVVSLVNQERAKNGLSALKATNATLTKMALDKAKDLYNNGYFDHNSPTYGSPFDMMKQYGISYRYAGENIAKGQRTPQEVMNAWMNSPGHRANILNANYTTIGVAYYNGVWVQEFIA